MLQRDCHCSKLKPLQALEGVRLEAEGLVQQPVRVAMEGGGCPERRLAVLAEVAYRAMAAMVDLVLVRLEPCFSCLSSDPCGSPLNLWMVARS